jgi:hypothetical protein
MLRKRFACRRVMPASLGQSAHLITRSGLLDKSSFTVDSFVDRVHAGIKKTHRRTRKFGLRSARITGGEVRLQRYKFISAHKTLWVNGPRPATFKSTSGTNKPGLTQYKCLKRQSSRLRELHCPAVCTSG